MATDNSISRSSSKLPVTCPTCGAVNFFFPCRILAGARFCNQACNGLSMVTHGNAKKQSQSAEYKTWAGIKDRCLNPSAHKYQDYGGRGITIFAEWRGSFQSFLAYVGKRPSSRHSIDRIKNEGNYEPGNVRWATRVEQQANRRNSRLFTLNGETHCISEWSRITGIHINTISDRLSRGLAVERALTK